MSAQSRYASPSKSVAISVFWAGKARTLRFSAWVAGVLMVLLPLLLAWYLAATLYVVFHDQILAALMSRQTDIQYSYEDRIAALKTELDRQTSRGLVDRHTLETTVHDLAERGARLQARAETIDALVADGVGRSPAPMRPPVASADTSLLSLSGPSTVAPETQRPSAPRPGLRLDGSIDTSAIDGSAVDVEARATDVAATFTAVETRQTAIVARLRDPAIRAVERMQAALALTGLPLGRRGAARADVGGPFVPLDDKTSTFGQSVELARDAVAEYGRLADLVDHVPLRRPLDGPIEVTSTFGARLDPFYGRPAMHTGIDLRESYGDKVEATAGGIVTIAGSEGGYGNMVEIDHGNGLATRYAHLSSIGVTVHQRVHAGDIVGRVGSTGRATGPHLHYETRINGEAVDPTRFLKAGSGLFPGLNRAY